ncbi:hypothetical protein JW921_10530 [Candidatus Fermentibacterales bacterium]|nr:hypothetical protein [Candidatus Fermentibacterales bacterium]
MLAVPLVVGLPAPSRASIGGVEIPEALPGWANPARVEPAEPDFERLFEADLGYLIENAQQAYTIGDFDLAARYYLLFLQADLNRNPIVIYNLACCYALMGEEALASRFLVASFRAGLDDRGFVDADPDFDSIRQTQQFQGAVAEIDSMMEEMAALRSDEMLYLMFPSLQTARLHLPEGYDPGREYPAVVALHGYTGSAEEFSRRFSDFENGDFIYLSLQAPYALPPETGGGYSWCAHGSQDWLEILPEDRRAELWERSVITSIDYVVFATMELREHYPVCGTYLLGFSQGGQLCYMTALLHPDIYDGVAAFGAPMIGEEWAPQESAPGFRVFIARGASEDDRGLVARDYFQSRGYDVTFYEHDGAHWVPAEGLRAFESWLN